MPRSEWESQSPCCRDHATPHCARSHRAGRPEAKEPQQTLRKAPSQSLILTWLLFSVPSAAGSRKNKERIRFQRNPEGTDSWLVGSEFGKSTTENDTAGVERGVGHSCRSGLEHKVGDNEKKKLLSAVALNQTSGWRIRAQANRLKAPRSPLEPRSLEHNRKKESKGGWLRTLISNKFLSTVSTSGLECLVTSGTNK